jgi:predicted Zn-dependent protease
MPDTLQTWRLFAAATVGLGAAWMSGCESPLITSATNALSGNSQALAMTDHEAVSLADKSFQDIVSTSPPASQPEYQAAVERVGRRLAEASARRDMSWDFKVVAGSPRTAVCFPGGKVLVYEGLFAVCENDADLAAVMSHEIGHALARHGTERMRNPDLVKVVDNLGRQTELTHQQEQHLLLEGAYGAPARVGAILPFSERHEAEANSISLMLMAKAGYDPGEATKMWSRLRDESRPATEFATTHPAGHARPAELERLVADAQNYYRSTPQKLGVGETLPQLATVAAASPIRMTAKPETTSAQPTAPALLDEPGDPTQPEAAEVLTASSETFAQPEPATKPSFQLPAIDPVAPTTTTDDPGWQPFMETTQ